MGLKFFLLAVISCFLTVFGYAQSERDSIYRVITNDKNEYLGRLVKRDSVSVTLMTDKLGEITIKTADIKSIMAVDTRKLVDGQYWYENPQATRYFWAPSGYGLRKGEGYYQNVWVFFNQVSYGFTDHLTVGAGIVPLFLFAGSSTPVWITPKLSIPIVKDKFNLGVGALVGTVLGEEESGFGILYGSGTVGSRDRNFTLGLGWGYAGGEFAGTPTINFSGTYRVARGWYLLTENYYFDLGDEDPFALISFGARYAARNIGVDFGLFVPIGDIGSSIFAPWLGIAVPFGKGRK
jgi:hypothetical protein